MGPGVPLSHPAPMMSFAPGMYLRESISSLRSTARLPLLVSVPETEDCVDSSGVEGPDYCSDIPDDILACIFQFLSTGDRKQCFRLCRRWLLVEGQSRNRLSLKAQSDIVPMKHMGTVTFPKCMSFEILHIERTPECTNLGLVYVARNCKLLRKLHIDGWRTNQICDEGFGSRRHCPPLWFVSTDFFPTRFVNYSGSMGTPTVFYPWSGSAEDGFDLWSGEI